VAQPPEDELITLRGAPLEASAVLQDRGITLVETLHATPPVPLPAADGPLCLGRFQTLGEIGRGGMGRVLEASDPELGRTVAVKVLIDPSEVSDAQLARFAAEARITSQLEHPNIVPIYDMGATAEGLVFFVMKKVVGRSLREIIDALAAGDEETARIWTLRRLLTTIVAVCNGVAFANDRGVLHRDIKPDNIMLGQYGEVLLMDWGVARLIGAPAEPLLAPQDTSFGSVPVTLDGVTVGTPGYMSPEQGKGDTTTLDAPSDVFSLGAVLYELLTLTRAYKGANVYATLFASVSGPPQDPRERAPDRGIPDELAEVCLRALEYEPADRYPTAGALAAAIEEFLEGSKRREAAALHLIEAEAAWVRYRAALAERAELEVQRRRLETSLESWLPIEEKGELLDVWERLASLGPESAEAFSELTAGCEGALSRDPGNPAARELLARAHYARFEEAETAGDAEDQAYFRRRVLAYDDDGHFAVLLAGIGSVSLRTDPPGAEVTCARFDQRSLVWPPVDERPLGHTPLVQVPLEPGSWLLTVSAPGRATMNYPVHLGRGQHWDGGDAPIPLLSTADLAPSERYVPAGPLRLWRRSRRAGQPRRCGSLAAGVRGRCSARDGRAVVHLRERCRPAGPGRGLGPRAPGRVGHEGRPQGSLLGAAPRGNPVRGARGGPGRGPLEHELAGVRHHLGGRDGLRRLARRRDRPALAAAAGALVGEGGAGGRSPGLPLGESPGSVAVQDEGEPRRGRSPRARGHLRGGCVGLRREGHGGRSTGLVRRAVLRRRREPPGRAGRRLGLRGCVLSLGVARGAARVGGLGVRGTAALSADRQRLTSTS